MFNLLIVDDEWLAADTLAENIPWSQYDIQEVHRAYSAMEALELMNTHAIDIVITDIRMPGFSGLELIQKLRESNRRTKCIVHSGHADFNYAREAMVSQVSEYLVKPASDDEVISAVVRMADQLRQEWAQMSSLHKASSTLKEQAPAILSTLVNDLLKGKKFKDEELEYKLKLLNKPFYPGDQFAIIVIRLEQHFTKFDPASLDLFEYAISNIAEETLSDHFHLLAGKDPHDYLVLIVKLDEEKEARLKQLNPESLNSPILLQQTAIKVQDNVRTFLKGKVSMVVSSWGVFPQDVSDLYQRSVSSIRRNVGNDEDIFLTLSDELQQTAPVRSLQVLYEPPLLMQLLDIGKKEPVLEKIEMITLELEEHWRDSREHLLEVYFYFSSAFTYFSHKSGKRMEYLLGHAYEPLISSMAFQSVKQLKDWAIHVTELLFEDLSQSMAAGKNNVVQELQNFVNVHLGEDVTLQALADHVHLHPVYLSKIFKTETGENLSDYIIRLKMERASYLLQHSSDKIYEICNKIGYQNSSYFIKLFRKYYGVTPQEYRDGQYPG
ncbi:response regulator [Paenibacillus roseipurpureus]|uniref:Response regulator n=1 Tax=Paenibacillus roseopurpureus TaxID=2918901 RepID=A0AA96RLU5_9BACL|nr:response regulator [Paenibacillus sp. MBLB1832]WNR46055.1 response regulator [Paenibacillus sp. MBLB1832]